MAHLNVRVNDHEHRPVSDARVTLRGEGMEHVLARVDEKGGYRHAGIAPGRYRLRVQAKGFEDD